MPDLSPQQTKCLHTLLCELVNQSQARILVPPYRAAPGFWFGGGNLVQDRSGVLWLSGRYRNYGDSRTGLEAGQRGLECTVWRSDDVGASFEKVLSWSKADLSREGREVLSIEGTALHLGADGTWELFISSEKALPYPEPIQRSQKPGTGIWSIDRMTGTSVEELDLTTLAPALENDGRPEYLHVKDPVVFDDRAGNTVMLFCSHPYSWTSTNTGLAFIDKEGRSQVRTWEVVPRGITWDVAVTRITSRLPVPQVGCFAGHPPCSVYFYDGAECIHDHASPRRDRRPRGYSCEEIGGAFYGWDHAFPEMERLSQLEPLFVSPWGTGCSRYVDSLVLEEGILTTWQQSQEDGSQPLVGHFLPSSDVERTLAGG